MPEKQQGIPFHRPMRLPDDDIKDAIRSIDDCLATGKISNQENVRELEQTIADHYDVGHAIATSSATQGLLIALQALYRVHPVPVNSVITPAFAWYSSMYAIESAGKTCLFVDIDPDTWTMQQGMYRMVMPVHTFGNVIEIDSDYTIYDGAHSLGSRIDDFGDATVLSLAPTKIITSIEGGIVITDDYKLATKIAEIRDKVSRMSEIHAIFGNAFLEYIDEVMKFKKKVFDYYSSNLDGTFQKTARHSSHNNHNTIGMLTDLKIPDCIETKKYYEPLDESGIGLMENTKRVYDRIVCLPSYFDCPYEQIVEIIKEFNKGE